MNEPLCNNVLGTVYVTNDILCSRNMEKNLDQSKTKPRSLSCENIFWQSLRYFEFLMYYLNATNQIIFNFTMWPGHVKYVFKYTTDSVKRYTNNIVQLMITVQAKMVLYNEETKLCKNWVSNKLLTCLVQFHCLVHVLFVQFFILLYIYSSESIRPVFCLDPPRKWLHHWRLNIHHSIYIVDMLKCLKYSILGQKMI